MPLHFTFSLFRAKLILQRFIENIFVLGLVWVADNVAWNCPRVGSILVCSFVCHFDWVLVYFNCTAAVAPGAVGHLALQNCPSPSQFQLAFQMAFTMCPGAMIALSRMLYIAGVKVYIANKSLITGYRCSFWFLFLVFGLHSSWIEIKKEWEVQKNSIHVRKIF